MTDDFHRARHRGTDSGTQADGAGFVAQRGGFAPYQKQQRWQCAESGGQLQHGAWIEAVILPFGHGWIRKRLREFEQRQRARPLVTRSGLEQDGGVEAVGQGEGKIVTANSEITDNNTGWKCFAGQRLDDLHAKAVVTEKNVAGACDQQARAREIFSAFARSGWGETGKCDHRDGREIIPA